MIPVLALTLLVGQIDAGTVDVVIDPVVVDAGVVELVDGGVVSVNPNVLDDLTPFVALTKTHIENGDWVSAVACVLVLLVGLFRMFAKRLHALIPDENPLDKFFFFMLETKPGGWILNFLTTSSLGLGSVLLVGERPTWAILKPILMLSVSMAGIWGLVKDLGEWIQSKLKKAEAEAEAKKSATPPAPGA